MNLKAIETEHDHLLVDSVDPNAKKVLSLLIYSRFEARSEKEYSNSIRDMP
jgi:hypothetical protein